MVLIERYVIKLYLLFGVQWNALLCSKLLQSSFGMYHQIADSAFSTALSSATIHNSFGIHQLHSVSQ